LLKYWREDGTRRINRTMDAWQIFRVGPAGTVGFEIFGIVFRAEESTRRKSAASITARGPLDRRQSSVNFDGVSRFAGPIPDQNKVMPGAPRFSPDA
jgi:hypothetical protein